MPVEINASPETVQAFLDIPLRSVDGRTVLLRDVANVRDGEAVATNIARLDGRNAVMISILKLGNASTIDIIDGIKARLPEIRASAPPGMNIEPIFDHQSLCAPPSMASSMKSCWWEGSSPWSFCCSWAPGDQP